MRSKFRVSVVVMAAFFAVVARAESPTASAPLSSDPRQLVAHTIANELEPGSNNVHLTYTETDQNEGKTQTKQVLETPEGTIDKVIAIDGKPLTSEQRSKEEQHLRSLVNNPASLAARREKQKQDDNQTNTLLKSIPDAFTFEYVATHSDRGNQIVTLRFSPNPNFQLPSRDSQVLTGMQGTMEISLPAARIVRIEGVLFRPVNFGWGILGQLNSGGRFVVEQAAVASGRWEVTHSLLRFTGKVLLVKNLDINEEQTNSNFRQIPALSMAEAVKLLGEQNRAPQSSAGQ